MNILHLANFNSTNIGNGALVFGTERVLREDLPSPLAFRPEPWDEYVIENSFGPRKFDAGFAALANAHDALLIGGAVTFNGRAHLTETGMRFNLPLALWPEIKRPIIFYGNAYRFWPSQTYHNQEQLRKALNYILASPSILFGVRNDGTKSFLEQLLGCRSEKIIAIPDPGIWVPAEAGEYAEIMEGKINIIVSLNNEDEKDRFPEPAKKERFLRALAAVLERISYDWDINVILCPHYFDDYKIMAEFMAHCPQRIAHQRMVSCGLLKLHQTSYFYGRYAKCDLALSMRMHSMSPAIGLGIPVVPLVSQARMQDSLLDMGLEEFGVDIFAEDVEERLQERITYCLIHRREVIAKLQNARVALRERTKVFNRRIEELL